VIPFCQQLVSTPSACASGYAISKLAYKDLRRYNARDKQYITVIDFIPVKIAREKRMAKESREYFTWTDDEVELLLSLTLEYKAEKSLQNIDWESIQSKYSDIHECFVAHGVSMKGKRQDSTRNTAIVLKKSPKRSFPLKLKWYTCAIAKLLTLVEGVDKEEWWNYTIRFVRKFGVDHQPQSK
jgi:hypothetical protein